METGPNGVPWYEIIATYRHSKAAKEELNATRFSDGQILEFLLQTLKSHDCSITLKVNVLIFLQENVIELLDYDDRYCIHST